MQKLKIFQLEAVFEDKKTAFPSSILLSRVILGQLLAFLLACKYHYVASRSKLRSSFCFIDVVSGDTSTEEIVAEDISKPQAASEAARVVLRGPRRSRAGIEDDARDYASRPKLRPKDYGKGMRLLARLELYGYTLYHSG